MAETETPFNPLDSLGPEYGSINPPNADEISYAPFEGDRIKMPEINFSASPIPSFSSLTQPQLNIKNTITGLPPGKPGSKPGQSTNDIASAFIDYSKSLAQANQDKNSYARIYSYNAGPSGNNFYKRYSAYGQEKFDEIGFSPVRDNEAIFNERTTKWNDFTRMMNHSFVPLVWQGIKSGPKSLWKMAHGDFTSGDLEDAELYEEASAIGQSTKGGGFGFINNAFMNFGYTAGIITEILAEEGAAFLIGAGLTATGIGAPTGGALFAGTTARNFGRIGLAFGKFGTKADDVFRGAVRGLENSDTARSFWRASQTKVGSFLNPLSNTFTAMNNIRKIEKFDNLTGLAKISRTAGGFYMDIKSINGAVSEARLESGMVENKVYQNLYDNYYEKNGKTPTNDQQYEMVKQSKLAGLETMGWNSALIYGSNKITFGNILNRSGGIRNILSSKTKSILNLGTGNVVGSNVKTAGSKIIKSKFNFIENNFKNALQIAKTQGVSKVVKGGATYFKANVTEGLQENAQETIAQALEGYYTDSFKSPAVGAHLYSRGATMMASKSDYFTKAWGEQNPFTAKGFETFATGFVMGGFAKPLNSLPGWASTGYNRIFKPEEFAKHKELKKTYGEGVAQELTDLSDDPIDFFESKIFNLGNQEIMAKIKESGGRKESLDASDQAFVSKISTALKTNTFDRFKDQLASYKNLTAEEFESEFPSVPKGEGAKYIARIDGIITKANEIQKSYAEINERFPSPIDLSQYEKGTDAYKKAAIFHTAWEGAKQNAIFMSQGYKDATERMKKIKNTLQANKPLSKMTDTELQILLEPSRLSNERELLRTEIESQRGILPAAEIAKKEVKLKALEEFSEAFAYYDKYEVLDKERQIQKLKAEGRFKGLKDASGNEITEAEAETEARDIINRSLKIKSRTKENTQEAEDRLELAYKNYLKAVASIHSDTYIERDADAAFELLLDSYKLGKEATILAGHVNMLHNPKEFISHVEKNYTWMNDLYNNRKDYYNGLVNQELNNIELNALLNELAEKNVYISADDAAEFQRSGRLPLEFFDDTRKAVIKEGHPEYNNYAHLFERANAVRTFSPEGRATDSTALNLALAKLNSEMQNEINNLPKTETTEELGKINLNGKESISIKLLQEQMEIEDYIDAEYMSGKKRKKVTFFKSKDGLKYDNEKGELVNVEKFAEKFVAGKKYKKSLKPDAIEVARIEKDYAEKRIELINKLNEKAKTEKLTQASTYIPFTVNTPLDQMDADLQTALTTSFQEYVSDQDMEDEVNAMSTEDIGAMFEDFIRTNPAAKKVITDYNKKKIEQLISEQIEEIEAPVMEINGEEVNFEELDIKGIKSNITKLEKNLEKLTNKPEEDLTPADKERIALLQFQITQANKYLSYKLNIKDSPKREAALKKIRKLLDEQNNIELDRVKNKYIVKGKEQEFEKVKNATNKLLSSYYEYPDTAIITEVYDATIGAGGTVDDFMKALRAKKDLKGFSKWTFNEVESELKTRTGEETPTTTDTKADIEKIIENSKLDNNAANRKLAEIAKNENIDLSKLTREEYVDYAIKNGLKISDIELRNAPELRTPTTMDETMALRKSLRDSLTEKTKDLWNKWTNSIELLASKSQKERYILDEVRVLSGTASSGSWLFFDINNSQVDSSQAPYKSYFSLKDFNNVTPDKVVEFMQLLQQEGYKGGIKTFQDLVNQGVLLNDQFVMHGDTEADAKLGERLAKEFFKENIKSTGLGKDGFENGKSKSYSQILSDKISNSINDIINGKTNSKLAALGTDTKADIDISEGEAVSVHTPRKLFKARLDRIKENQEGKRRADYTASPEGYVVSLMADKANENDNQGRNIHAGAEVYLNEEEKNEIKRIEAKRKGGFINANEKSEALQQVYRDAFKRALDTYEIVEDAEFETEVEDRRSKYNATTTDTKADIERRNQYSIDEINRAFIGEATYFGPNWNPSDLATIVENTETVYAESKQEAIDKINKLYAKELAALEGTTELTDKEYNDFINNGVVSEARITSIANKIKKSEKLSQKETEIFTDKTAEVNAKLKSTAKRKVTLNEVLALVSEKAYENKGITNTYVSAQIRNFLAGVEVEKNSEMIDDDAFDALFGTDSILSTLKEQIDNGDLIPIPNNIKLYDETSGIAGEIDLLLIDREGKVFIVDIRTGKKDDWDNYDEPTNNLSPKQSHALELTAYKNMLYNMYGIEASIGILPIQVTTDSGTGKILTVKKADGVLKPDRITFKIDVNEESIVGVDDNNNVNYGKTFQQLLDTIIERTTPTGETIEEIPLTPEDKEIQEEVKKLTAGQKKSQDRNIGILIDKIQTLRERQTLLDADISKINDTLKFLDTILNQSIDLTTEDIIGLINNIDSLDKVTGQLIKSKLTKRGGKIQLRAKDLRAQIRREFAIANEITNRINELKREKERILEPLKQDLKKQADYYQSLLDDPNMTLYNAAEIKQKIATVKRKISTIEKLIRIIQNAISKSVAYLKEYVKIWETSNKNYNKFKKETGYKALSSEEIKSLIDSVDSADKATLENYPNLTKEFNKLESNLLDAMDSVELIEDVQAEETSRLNQLQGALQKYDDQLRYLNELLEPSGKESLENKISDKNSSGPKPTEVKKASAENKKQTIEAIDRSKDSKVISTFSLADMADLGNAITGEQAVNKDLRTVLEAISKAKTPEEITELSKNLKDFKAGEMKMILDVVKERLQELTTEFKDSVKDQLDTTIGSEYVTINPIGDIQAGTLIVITAVVGDNVTVAIVNSNTKKSVKFDKLIGNIMTPAQAKESTATQVVDITKEVKSVLQTSKTAADNLSDSEIDEIIGSVKTLDLGDLEEDLFNMEIC